MASEQPRLNVQTSIPSRGANRSTKLAGKLKVLPEQPYAPSLAARTAPILKNVNEGSSGTVGLSEDGDVDDDDEEEEPEDVTVEVRCHQ
jgi:hypothetical protein